jgi:hypothetical protein
MRRFFTVGTIEEKVLRCDFSCATSAVAVMRLHDCALQVYQRQLSKQGLQSIVVDEKEQANALSRCVCFNEGTRVEPLFLHPSTLHFSIVRHLHSNQRGLA